MEEKYKAFEQNDEIDMMNNVVCFLYFRLVTEDSSQNNTENNQKVSFYILQ